MKKKKYDVDLEETVKEPRRRKRSRGSSFIDGDYIERKLKKSGKRFHRRPTHKDDFSEE